MASERKPAARAAENTSPFGFDTLQVHAGTAPDPATGARTTPIYQTTAFVFEDADQAASLFNLQTFGNIYTRLTNPTTAVFEQKIAALENARAATAVASGHAAQLVAFHMLMNPGDHIVASRKLYGGSITQLGVSFKRFDWHTTFVDPDDIDGFAAAVTPKTKAIFVESLANPGGVISDIEALADVAHKAGIPLIVDNTMATPYLCRPIEWGADIVLHSATKFLGGHGNSMGGVIVDSGLFDWGQNDKFPHLSQPSPAYHGLTFWETFGDMAFAVACRTISLRDLGPAISPFNAFMILTGMETLSLRMRKHCDNAQTVAEFLARHPKVEWVSYAGLKSDRYHALAQKYLPRGAGSVFTFGLKGGYESGTKFVESLQVFSHLANIGDTRSLVIHPASTTHRQLSPEQRAAAGAGDNVIRLSIGIEDVADLIKDLEKALAAA
ncbi:O-acetylhomoserine aminocarboxypropyltransferase [Ferrovibrio sp.]|uniref:O-acetylhomoserine aminocarboxypropyltransferase n=1 Tax=Ferrovibrio sp. TaxID=1917215 RepID=UPI00260AD692|nr:O-acetylhomoserine aminocarboxypropyltransferase [Ferrovibrio sp.]